jgi:phenylalanyl-tRNA synthetase beta subunit
LAEGTADGRGARPISNVVDITNYVMLRSAPVHAYDGDAPRRHRPARAPAEELRTLTGRTGNSIRPTVIADRSVRSASPA